MRRAACQTALVLASWILVTGMVALVGAAATAPRHVLYLNSYHAGYEWSDNLVAGMRSVLDARPYPRRPTRIRNGRN